MNHMQQINLIYARQVFIYELLHATTIGRRIIHVHVHEAFVGWDFYSLSMAFFLQGAHLKFILTNVVERDGRCQWKLNLQYLDTGLDDIVKNLPTFESTYNGPVIFIKGGYSEYVRYVKLMEHILC